MAHVFPARRRREHRDARERWRVEDRDRVEKPVVDASVGRDLEHPAEVPTVRDDQHEVRARATSDGGGSDVDGHSIELEELTERGAEVEEVAGEEGNVLEVVEDGDIEAEARHVEEVAILDAADVDEHLGALHGERCRGSEIARGRADGFGEVVAGAGGEQCEPASGAGGENRVRRVAPRAVAAAGDDRRRAIMQRERGEALFVARALGDPHIGDADGGESLDYVGE